jgi:hypothetical protein
MAGRDAAVARGIRFVLGALAIWRCVEPSPDPSLKREGDFFALLADAVEVALGADDEVLTDDGG